MYIIGASLSKPHIDRDNGPRTWNNGMSVSMYLCLYHLPRVCRTLIPEIHVRPKMLHVFRYIDVELLVSAVKIIDEDR